MADILWISLGVFIGLVLVLGIILASGGSSKQAEKKEEKEAVKAEKEEKAKEPKAKKEEGSPKVLAEKEPAEEKAEPVKEKEEKPAEKKEGKAEKKESKKEKVEEEPVEQKEDENQTYRIVYDKEQKNWIVRIDGGKRASRRCKTKEEALKVAKELAKKKDADLSVHKKNGKFQKQ